MEQKGPHILAVDDDPAVRQVVQRSLESAGYRCSAAKDTFQAAELLQHQRFDLVLLDVIMPGRTGMEYLTELRAKQPNLPVVMVTGVGDLDTAVSCLKLGAYDYVTKPFKVVELVTKVNEALVKSARLSQVNEEGTSVRAELERKSKVLAQKERELQALNTMFQAHLRKSLMTEEAYTRLKKEVGFLIEELKKWDIQVAPKDEEDGNGTKEPGA